MNYEIIINDMLWSHSRLGTFTQCPYKFLIKYIHGEHEEPMFFSSFGSFMHELIAAYLKGDASPEELKAVYLNEFQKNVLGAPPSKKIFKSYLKNGLRYFDDIARDLDVVKEIIGIEKKYRFHVGDIDMIGFVDVVGRNKDGDLFIMDHKSRKLKKRSRSGKTKGDAELDEYLRQLYLYSIPVEYDVGELPKYLILNCFMKDGDRLVVERFNKDVYNDVKKWYTDNISKVVTEDEWKPVIDFWQCTKLCGMKNCEYREDM